MVRPPKMILLRRETAARAHSAALLQNMSRPRRLLKLHLQGKLNLSRGSGKPRTAKRRICRAGDTVSISFWYWTGELAGAIDLIYVLHIHTIQKIQHFRAGIQLYPFGHFEKSLQTNIRVVVGGAKIGVPANVADTIVEWEPIAIHI